MELKEKVNIEGDLYLLKDVKNVVITDSFVLANKLSYTTGHGEARLYTGSVKTDYEFFNNFQNIKGLFYKNHLLSYLDDAKFEYQKQSQTYRKDISKSWVQYRNTLIEQENKIFFTIEDANGETDKSRFYIRSNDKIYKSFREIILPIMTKLSILKLINDKEKILYLFKPFIDYFEDSKNIEDSRDIIEKIENDSNLEKTKKEIIIQARIGQGKYRQDIIKELSHCIITNVNDVKLLIASHIKPWAKCDSNQERIDKYNGLLLTPTYDKLFDSGLITIEKINKNENAKILISPYLSKYNISRLQIPSECQLNFNIKRCEYLEYHKKNIFLNLFN